MQEVCYHCGLDCEKDAIYFDEKQFCCNGCKSVYEILNTDSLKNFYQLNSNPGIKPSKIEIYEYDFLDQQEVQEKLWLFKDEHTAIIRFQIPVIHCSSCVWVLESLKDIQAGIRHSKVNFTQKNIQINYDPNEISLKEIAIFLTRLGYKPTINLSEESEENQESFDKKLIIKLGIAGFCFGNVMLFAFPEYFTEFKDSWFEQYKYLFRYIMFTMSLPVVFYCASSYFKSAYTGIKNRLINIDIPISIGIVVLFLRSVYEVMMNISSGYFDSLCGLVFFMLIGKFFQQNTYKSLSFDRNYKSFYPITVTRIQKKIQENVMINELQVGDRILVRNGEMIPADAVLINGEGFVDNSFITGESNPIIKKIGEKIFAGGKQKGPMIELEIIKEVNQSYLTSLWQNTTEEKHAYFSTLIEKVSKYFTLLVLLIALVGGVIWYFIDSSQMFQVVTAVLIVACPCALALATPFTLGNVMRILGMHQIYVKDITTLEKINAIQEIVLDKTGTLTETKNTQIAYFGQELSNQDLRLILGAIQNSTHPLSRKLTDYLKIEIQPEAIFHFQEIEGKGIKFQFENDNYRLGSKDWLEIQDSKNETAVYIEKNDEVMGRFIFTHQYRKGLANMIGKMKNHLFSVVSGDNEGEKEKLQTQLQNDIALHFNQNPEEKVEYIKNLQHKGNHVMMIGDGLNDAAALQQSDVGVAITDDVNNFTPASDIIMRGNRLITLPSLFRLSQKGVQLIKISMLISFLYNIVGLSFALSGMLSPLVAAILMPISSISVVIFASISTWYFGNRYFGNS